MNRSDSIERNDETVVLAYCPDGFIAMQAVDILAQEGITAVIGKGIIWAGPILGSRATGPGVVTISVKQEDAERAREILAAFPPLAPEPETGPGGSQ